MAFLHEHRRRVPTQDHLCRIGVGVFKVAAACADKVLSTLNNGPNLRDHLSLVVADRFFASSKTCSACHAKAEALPLSVSLWSGRLWRRG